MSNEVVKSGQWLEDRKKGIGGSEIGIILGLNPHKSPYQLWEEKTGRNNNVVDNNFTRAGIKLEPMVADWFAEVLAFSLINPGQEVVKHADHEFALGTPDRITLNMKGDKGVLEIKTTGNQVDKENPPLIWFCQVTWYTGILKSHTPEHYNQNYIAWFERMTCAFDYIDLGYDPQFFQFLLEKAGEFWTKYVQTDTPPPPMSLDDLTKMYKEHQPGKVVIATPELTASINSLKDIRSYIKNQEKEEEKLKIDIQKAMQDAEAIYVDGMPAITWKSAKESLKFDTARFAEEHPELYQKYQISTPGSRRFLIK